MIAAALLMIAAPVAATLADDSVVRRADYGRRLFERLAGGPLPVSDPRYAEYVARIAKKDLKGAAAIATGDDGFYAVTLRNWAAVMTNGGGTPLVAFDDFQAMVIGVARDELDARTLLTGDFRYRAPAGPEIPEPNFYSNEHYQLMDERGLDLRTTLIRSVPQWPGANPVVESAGILTLRAWASKQYEGGTNRRAVVNAFATFLCSPIATWKNAALSDFHVRRDVSRVPGGDPATYQTTCRACHAPMDAFAGAFARFDFDPEIPYFSYLGPGVVAPKYNQNASTYPAGWVTTDDSWINMLQGNPEFGWRTAPEGKGIGSFGKLLADSAQFSRCMVKRSFKSLCRRDPEPAEQERIKTLAAGFEAGGYRIKDLFEEVAITPECLGAP